MVNRSVMNVLLLVASVFLLAVNANAALYVQTAGLETEAPVSIDTENSLNGSVDFGFEFQSIDSIQMRILFGDDLYDRYRSDIVVIWYTGYVGMAYATGGVDAGLYDEYYFDTNWEYAIEAMMDGTNNIRIGMNDGSVDIVSVEVWVTGTPVPVPGTCWLLGACLIGLAGVGRKKKYNDIAVKLRKAGLA